MLAFICNEERELGNNGKPTHQIRSGGTVMKLTERTQLRRLPKRGSHDPATVHGILDAGFLAHVGFNVDGQPFVIPTLYGRQGDKLYMHGSAASRMLRQLEGGISACVTVTLVDGLVLARSAFHHSMNYRSVVAFGTAKKIDDPEHKQEALRVISEHLIAGRWDDVRGPHEKELKATAVLEFNIEEASAKVRTGPPLDEEEDYNLPVWAGVVPLQLEAQEAIPDSRLRAGIRAPDYVAGYRRGSSLSYKGLS
jgi:nitroimidazol reductase NimA-like FMN-containing flavoprotein (pyridoxamine 5'-phosphate oxidase superfamily)